MGSNPISRSNKTIMSKYTQDYKLKEPSYLKVGFKRKSVKYNNGVKIIKYEKK